LRDAGQRTRGHSIEQETRSTRGKLKFAGLKFAGLAMSVRIITINSNPVCRRWRASAFQALSAPKNASESDKLAQVTCSKEVTN
jgi:hypothetical protein